MKISRRELLKAIPAFAAASAFPLSVLRAAEPLAKKAEKRLVVGSNNKFCMLDIERGKTLVDIDLPFYPHSFVPEPNAPENIWAIQRYNYEPGTHRILDTPYTSRAVRVNITSGKITGEIQAPEGSVFNGHGLFLPGGNVLYGARAIRETSEGQLTGFDVTTGNVVADHTVSEAGIHECRVASDGTVFIARSGVREIKQPDGSTTHSRIVKSGLVHYDLVKGKRISFTPIEAPEQLLGHFCILKNGMIIATAVQIQYKKQIPPLAYMGREGDACLKPLDYNTAVPSDNKPGELFNVAVYEEKNMGVISSLAHNYVILVDLDKQAIVKKIDFLAPWGIQVDKARNEFIISGDQYIGVIDTDFTEMRKLPLDPHGVVKNFSSGHSLFL